MTIKLSSPPILDVVTHAHNSQLANSVFAWLKWLKLKLRIKKMVKMLDVFLNHLIITNLCTSQYKANKAIYSEKTWRRHVFEDISRRHIGCPNLGCPCIKRKKYMKCDSTPNRRGKVLSISRRKIKSPQVSNSDATQITFRQISNHRRGKRFNHGTPLREGVHEPPPH